MSSRASPLISAGSAASTVRAPSIVPGHEVLSTPKDAPSADHAGAFEDAGDSLGLVVAATPSSGSAEDVVDGRAEPQATSTVATTARPAARRMLPDDITLRPHPRAAPAHLGGTPPSPRGDPLDVGFIAMATTLPLESTGVFLDTLGPGRTVRSRRTTCPVGVVSPTR